MSSGFVSRERRETISTVCEVEFKTLLDHTVVGVYLHGRYLGYVDAHGSVEVHGAMPHAFVERARAFLFEVSPELDPKGGSNAR